MKKLMMSALFVSIATVSFAGQSSAPNSFDGIARLKSLAGGENVVRVAGCFKTGEQTSGMNKICYYNCVTGGSAITIGATQLCPLSI
jgi:hypothetical protein